MSPTAADLEDDGRDETPLSVGRSGGGRSANKSGGSGSGTRGSPSLKDLVEAGVLIPGKNKITCAYKGMTAVATLMEDGTIEYQGKRYNSATAFSIHYKRQITPSKQGDDGWKSVAYDGRPLEHYRKIYLQQLSNSMRAQAVASGHINNGAGGGGMPKAPGSASRPPMPPSQQKQHQQQQQQAYAMPAAAAAPSHDPQADTDRWVECERCQTWRAVPLENWAAVQNDPREEWYCQYATWSVATQPPYTPGCQHT